MDTIYALCKEQGQEGDNQSNVTEKSMIGRLHCQLLDLTNVMW